MSEQISKGGLSPDFSLAVSITDAQIGKPATQLIIEAADLVSDGLYIDTKTGFLKQEAWFDNLDTTIDDLGSDKYLIVYVADLDRFKEINDSLGHDAGDELLGIVAKAFRQTFKRETDEVAHGSRERQDSRNIARLGGDEFAISTVQKADDINKNRHFVADNSEEEIESQAERVNAELQELLANTKFAPFKPHISMGGAIYVEGDTSKTLFARADMNMFHTKYKGKIDNVSEDDRERLYEIIEFLRRVGARVEPWLINATNKT